MSVWLTIPSARPPAEANHVLEQWKKQGYKIALAFDDFAAMDRMYSGGVRPDHANYYYPELGTPYPGYAKSVNNLLREITDPSGGVYDPDAEWFVAGGDDTLPDLNHTADEIAAQCRDYFLRLSASRAVEILQDGTAGLDQRLQTFGVMQPTGDRFAGGQIDRICGSPWLGREWCRRINQGRGPLWSGDPASSNPIISEGYRHMFVDEECQNVALKYGALWQRPDLIHLHKHFMRESDAIDSRAVGGKQRPAFLDEANSREHWMKYEKLFKDRRAAGFPGSEPL